MTEGETRVVAVEGELELSTIDVLGRGVDDRLGESPGNLTLDLSTVTFMDSSGPQLPIDLGDADGVLPFQTPLRL